MNKFYNLILNMSYLSLPLAILAFVVYEENNFGLSVGLFLAASLLILINYLMINYSQKEAEIFDLNIKSFETKNENMFMVFPSFIIPIACKQVNVEALTLIIVITLLIICCYYINSFLYNPVFSFFQWKFYSIETPEGGKYTLLTKKKIINKNNIITVLQITDYVLITKE